MAQQRFDKLLRSIHNAVLRAQEITESQHIHQLDKYFDETGKPIVQEIEVPSLHPDAEAGATEVLKVPLLTLIPPSAIKIKELRVSFNTVLMTFDDTDGGKDDEGIVTTDTTGTTGAPGGDSQARVEITFVGTDPAESFLRINDHLIKSIL